MGINHCEEFGNNEIFTIKTICGVCVTFSESRVELSSACDLQLGGVGLKASFCPGDVIY